MPTRLARNIVIPKLPEFLNLHPKLSLELSCTDRIVDVISEGFDCVLRVGNLRDSSLVARPLGYFPTLNCASPAYIKCFGTPKKLSDLAKHHLIHYAPQLGSKPEGFEYFDGESYRIFEMGGVLTVNNTDAYEAACLAGLGIIQVPDLGARAQIKAGRYIEILPKLKAEPMPVNLIYASRKHLSKRVQVFMSWLQEVLQPHTVK
jgi:DNA-binding transcriptional LysR family regulator